MTRKTHNRLIIFALIVSAIGVLSVLFLEVYTSKVMSGSGLYNQEKLKTIVYKTKVEYIYIEKEPEVKYVYIEKEPDFTEMSLPDQTNKFISYLPHDKITRKGSKQLAYVVLGKPDENAMYKYQDKFMVAMGSYYGELGTCFKVTMSEGGTIEIIMTERKADKDTDKNNQYCIHNGSVLEFIVDEIKLPKEIRENSQIQKLIGGFPIKIERIEND